MELLNCTVFPKNLSKNIRAETTIDTNSTKCQKRSTDYLTKRSREKLPITNKNKQILLSRINLARSASINRLKKRIHLPFRILDFQSLEPLNKPRSKQMRRRKKMKHQKIFDHPMLSILRKMLVVSAVTQFCFDPILAPMPT